MGRHYIMQENNSMQFAGFFVRFAAFLADSLAVYFLHLLAWLFVFILTLQLGNAVYEKEILFRFTAWDILCYSITTVYYVYSVYTNETTLGKRLFHLKVIAPEEEKLTLFTVLYRETIGKYLSSALFFMGYFIIGMDKEKKGLHDILSGTRVVYTFEKINKNMEDTYIAENYKKKGSEACEDFLKLENSDEDKTPEDGENTGVAKMEEESGWKEIGNGDH